jgi:hypothetical protein
MDLIHLTLFFFLMRSLKSYLLMDFLNKFISYYWVSSEYFFAYFIPGLINLL